MISLLRLHFSPGWRQSLLALCLAGLFALTPAVAATVEVNEADVAALEAVPGLGPVHAKAIVDERTKNGPFKDAADLAHRVKGLGEKSVARLQSKGLTISGKGGEKSDKADKADKADKSGKRGGKPKSEKTEPASGGGTAPGTGSGTDGGAKPADGKGASGKP